MLRDRTLWPQLLIFLFVIVVILFVSYSPILQYKHVSNVDGSITYDAVNSASGFNDYFSSIRNGKIADLQPVRDIGYKIDGYLSKIFKRPVWIWTNIFIWIIALLLVLGILKKKFVDLKIQDYLLVCIMAIHPILTNVLTWGVAKKHILAFFFIVLATFILINFYDGLALKKRKIVVFFIWISFLFSILSNPINILWPVWVFIYLCKGRYNLLKIIKNHVGLFSSLFTTSVIVTVANLWYYKTIFLVMSGGAPKYSSIAGLSKIILSLGRTLIQIVYPTSLAVFYFKGSILNMIGIVLAPFVIYILIRSGDYKRFLLWLSLYFIALAPVTLIDTQIFIFDTYLLVPLFTFTVLIIMKLKEIKVNYKWFVWLQNIFLVSILLLFLVINRKEVVKWNNSELLFEKSYKNEPSCINLVAYANNLMVNRKYKLLSEHVEKIIERKCLIKGGIFNIAAPRMFILQVVNNKKIDIEQKISILKKIKIIGGEAVLWSMLSLYLQNREEGNALNIIKEIDMTCSFIRDVIAVEVAKEVNVYCEKKKSKKSICKQIVDVLNKRTFN